MIGRIIKELLLHLMVVHPKAVAAVTEGGGFRTDPDDAGDENSYGLLLGASHCLFFSVTKLFQLCCLLA
jgi:hypothetical protein